MYTLTPLIVLIQLCSASKVWVPTLDFHNPSNWASQKVQEPGQSVQFPVKLNAIVKLPDSISMDSLILPQNGVLLVPDTEFSLVFEIGRKHREPAQFKTPVRKPYFSPENWMTFDEGRNAAIELNSAVPHLERIPCQYETAMFPDTPAPVDMQYHEAIEVKDINYGGTSGLDEFRHFLSTELGQYVFYNAEETLVKQGKCGSPEKCPCQPDKVKGSVCANVECQVPRCLNPIVPVGHCCAICGSMLTMDLINFVGKFELTAFSNKLERKIAASDVDKSLIDYHVSVQNNALQLVAVDRDVYEANSVRLMKSLDQFFMKQFLNGHTILHSGHPYTPYESGQLFLVVFISLLAVSVFFTVIYVYYYDDKMVPRITAMVRNRQFFASPFVFARFDPNSEQEESTVDIDFNPSGVENLNSSFNNPMFEENPKDAASSGGTEKKLQQDSYTDVELKSQHKS